MARHRSAALARLLAVLFTVLLVLMGAIGCGARLQGVPLIIATGPVGGVYEGLGRGLAEVWGRQGAVVTPTSTPGSVANVGLLLAGQADVAICQADVAAQIGSTGAGGPLRALARLHDDYVQVLVRGDVPVSRVGQLRGLRVSIGEPGSGVAFTAGRVLTAAGLRDTDLQESELSLGQAIPALQAGTIDGFFWSGGVPTTSVQTMVAAMAERGTTVRMLDLSDVATSLQAKYPGVYQRGTVAAARAYPGLTSAIVPTLVVRNFLLTTTAMDDDRAALLTRGLIESLPELRTQASVTAARQLDARAAIETDPVALHPGAESYYRSVPYS
jgi:TRAP transporter TAXI family solute receptor